MVADRVEDHAPVPGGIIDVTQPEVIDLLLHFLCIVAANVGAGKKNEQ